MDTGILYRGERLPGSDFVRRDLAGWFDAVRDPADVSPRGAEIQRQLTGHWTAGHCLSGDGVARAVVSRMRARLRENGSPMSVSIPFAIGWDGQVWQTCDLGLYTIHAGRRFNRAGPGVECTWPGTAKQGKALGYEFAPERRLVRGRPVLCMPPSPALIDGWRRLWAFLRTVRRDGLEIARVREHFQAPGTTKVDAAGYLIEAAGATAARG